MDITSIAEAIKNLEAGDTTYDTVQELASLYIVYEHLVDFSDFLRRDDVNEELQDIMPYYMKYRDIKRRYQFNQTNEGEVIQGIKNVCQEITEFIEALYSGTDMNKERRYIKDMISMPEEKLLGVK